MAVYRRRLFATRLLPTYSESREQQLAIVSRLTTGTSGTLLLAQRLIRMLRIIRILRVNFVVEAVARSPLRASLTPIKSSSFFRS